MLIQPCRIPPSDEFSSIKTAPSYTTLALLRKLWKTYLKSKARWIEAEVWLKNAFVWEKATIYSFYSIRNRTFCPHGKASMLSCVVLSTWYIPYMDSHCGSRFGFLDFLPLGFLVFNFHLGRIMLINDLNESSNCVVRMNSWNKPAHWSVWNSEWMGARG